MWRAGERCGERVRGVVKINKSGGEHADERVREVWRGEASG